MKTGKDIRELAQEIYRQQQAKKDFVAPHRDCGADRPALQPQRRREELRVATSDPGRGFVALWPLQRGYAVGRGSGEL